MASWIWNSMRSLFTFVFRPWGLRGNRHNTDFSLRLLPQQKRALRAEADVTPFENFWNAIRMLHLAEFQRQDISIMEAYCLKRNARRMWRFMPLRNKRIFFELARHARIKAAREEARQNRRTRRPQNVTNNQNANDDTIEVDEEQPGTSTQNNSNTNTSTGNNAQTSDTESIDVDSVPTTSNQTLNSEESDEDSEELEASIPRRPVARRRRPRN